jgi:hypothetical protein
MKTKTPSAKPHKVRRASKVLKKTAPKLRRTRETPYDRTKHLLDKLTDLPANPSLQTLSLKGKTQSDRIMLLSRTLNSDNDSKTQSGHTPYDRIKHLLGILTELPPDLRTNPKYFEGFGS